MWSALPTYPAESAYMLETETEEQSGTKGKIDRYLGVSPVRHRVSLMSFPLETEVLHIV